MAHDRKFRFGVQVGGPYDAAGWTALARKVEDLGYTTLYMPDHFVDTELAPMVGISFAAAATDRLRVGMLVLGNDYKHPAVTAKEAATVDVLSDGRLEFGIGAGWMQADYEALGLPYDSAGVRIDRLGEALRIIKGAWGDEPFDHDGKHYTVRAYNGMPRPVQRPRPPIVVGGGGPRLLRLAGQEADIVGINPNLRVGAITGDAMQTSLAAETRKKLEWIREGAGSRFDDLELQVRYFIAAITDDAHGVANAVADYAGTTVDEALASAVALIGTVDEICDTLLQRREEWGVSYVVLGHDTYEAFAPVVARLAGT